MTQPETVADGDEGRSSQFNPIGRGVVIWLVLAVALYVLDLVVTLPAAVLISAPPNVTISGTIWQGQATLPGGGQWVWNTAVLRSFATLSFTAGWHLTGPDTDIEGGMRLRPFSLSINDASGRATTALLKAFMPDLTFLCEGEARIDFNHLSWTSSAFDGGGEVRTAPATCPMASGPPVALPPLVATLATVGGVLSATVTTVGPNAVTVATAALAATGRLTAELRPEAAKIIPGLPRTAGSFQLETAIFSP